MDLTVGDYLDYLKVDAEVAVFAVYVEGFAPRDGVKFLKAAEEISARGKTVCSTAPAARPRAQRRLQATLLLSQETIGSRAR